MQKIYSLLRNNKQSGPYTLDELLQLSLKPFDLVWVQGKSGGWSYPSEIDALKSYVAETPKVIEKKAEPIAAPQATPSTINEPVGFATAIAKATNLKTGVKNIYISFPGGRQSEGAFTSSITAAAVSEESPEAKLERKALELRNKIQAFAENKNQPKADNELDTKYTRSLEDIKEEYSSWLHKQQKKKSFISKKPTLIIAGVAALVIAGYLILPIFSSKKTITEEPILSAQEIKASAPAIRLDEEDQTVEKKRSNIKSSKKTKVNTVAATTPLKIPSIKNEDIDKVDNYRDSLKSKERTKQQPNEETVYEPAVTKEDGARQNTKRDADVADSKTSQNKNENENVPFSELVKLSESTGSGSPHLSLYNNSNKHINFVAIDISYYKANKKLLQKRTLYFKDIAPKSSAKLFVPQEKNASTVDYQMGLISTDNGLYYAKQ
jgi:hypothetical protein